MPVGAEVGLTGIDEQETVWSGNGLTRSVKIGRVQLYKGAQHDEIEDPE